jgi:hypothetical protein
MENGRLFLFRISVDQPPHSFKVLFVSVHAAMDEDQDSKRGAIDQNLTFALLILVM